MLNNGKVGIGTTEPKGNLHIGGPKPDIFLFGQTSSNQDGLRIHYNEETGARCGVIDVKGLSLRVRGESGTTGDGATERLRIDLTTGLLVNQGNTKLSGAAGINRDPIATQHLVIQPAKDNIALNVVYP